MYSGTHQGGLNREVAALHSDHIIEVPLYNNLKESYAYFGHSTLRMCNQVEGLNKMACSGKYSPEALRITAKQFDFSKNTMV